MCTVQVRFGAYWPCAPCAGPPAQSESPAVTVLSTRAPGPARPGVGSFIWNEAAINLFGAILCLSKSRAHVSQVYPSPRAIPCIFCYKTRQARISNECRIPDVELALLVLGTVRRRAGPGPGGASHGTRAFNLEWFQRPWNLNASLGCPGIMIRVTSPRHPGDGSDSDLASRAL